MTPSGGTPCNIKVTYTSLKSTFNARQIHRLAVVGYQFCEILRNSAPIRFEHNISKTAVLQPFLIDPPAWRTDGRAIAYSVLNMRYRALKLIQIVTTRSITTSDRASEGAADFEGKF